MTTLHDAARKALDALDRAISDDRAYIRECKDAAEAIRAHLAAQPAPAQPVPLTQDQIADCTRTAHRACDAKGPMTRWSTEFARAIEAAHGITGGSK